MKTMRMPGSPPPPGVQPLTIRRITARAVNSPMKRPLRTSVGSVTAAPLVLIDLETEEGITGHAYLFAYVPPMALQVVGILRSIEHTVRGRPVVPIEILRVASQPYRLLGTRGLIDMALAGLDVACWDVIAKSVQLPLARLLGGALTPIPAYNSNGLGIMPAAAAADEAQELLAEGFSAIKLRLGHPTLRDDLKSVRGVRKKMPVDAVLMTDYNHALSVAEALERGHALDQEGVYWIEEPTAFDDFSGNARIAASLRTPVQIGENFTGVAQMKMAIDAGASDFVMPDLERIGGVTGWIHAAGLAAAAGIKMSSHLFAEVSAHLLAATPTCHWLEFVDWADAVLAKPLTVKDGHVAPSPEPGVGLSWNEDAVQRCVIEST